MEESMKCFEKALRRCETVPEYLSQAIFVTLNHTDSCSKISWWRDGIWELIEEFLNTHPKGVDMEYFIQGCALLGE